MPGALAEMKVLVFDCQATGSRPETAHLLELGWAEMRAANKGHLQNEEVRTYLAHLPDHGTIPKRVQDLTGLTKMALAGGKEPDKIWDLFFKAADRIAKNNGMATCPTLIHFAGFEKPFIQAFHGKSGPSDPLPLKIICTHKIAKRLFNDETSADAPVAAQSTGLFSRIWKRG